MQILESEIHLWHADKADFPLPELQDHCFDWLTEKEQHRYQRYYFDTHRQQLLLGRFLARSVLSQYTETIDPGDWRFVENEYGKPAIDPLQNQDKLFFNLSHSGDKLVLAVARLEQIGIDIERSDKARRVQKISSRFFSAREVEELLALAEEAWQQRFYQLWTLKEAYIKACGLGLAIPLQHFSYGFPDATRLSVSFDAQRADDPAHWQIWQLAMKGDYELALAVKNETAVAVDSISSWSLSSLQDFRSTETRIVRSA